MSDDGIRRAARMSLDGVYRYWLTRRWDPRRPQMLAVMLNPSEANHARDDHTVRKLYGFATRWGYGGFAVGNAHAFKATDPRALKRALAAGVDIIGPENDATLARLAVAADMILVAWGASFPPSSRPHLARITELLQRHGDLYCIGRTKAGVPRHPLMVSYQQQRELYRERADA